MCTRSPTASPSDLGGVLIEHPRGCVAHSDGDALIHALCDALLGAAAMGDIGLHFPDTSERFKGIDSRILLRHTVEMLRDKGYRIGNVDCTLCLQRPKIKPYIAAMRETLAETMGIDPERVSVEGHDDRAARIRRPGRGSRGSCRRAGLQGNPIAKTLPGRQSSPPETEFGTRFADWNNGTLPRPRRPILRIGNSLYPHFRPRTASGLRNGRIRRSRQQAVRERRCLPHILRL